MVTDVSSMVLKAAPIRHLATHYSAPIVKIQPESGSKAWVSAIARFDGLPEYDLVLQLYLL
jgi:hypothetical protein